MAILPVITISNDLLTIPSTTLRLKSEEIKTDDPPTMDLVKQLVEDMFETMYASPWGGVGLAAPQVGILWQLFVVDAGSEPLVVINPQFTYMSEEKEVGSETCLSLPFMAADVERNKVVKIEFFNLNGDSIRREEEGFMARVLQHEADHLDGVLYVDRLTSFKEVRNIDLPSVRATRKTMKKLTEVKKSPERP